MDLETLERKLDFNYNMIRDQSIAGDVLNYMNRNPEPQNNAGLLFIKKFTKVADNILDKEIDLSRWQQDNSFSNKQLLWLVKYNDIAIIKIVEGDYEDTSTENAQKILCHIYSHNASLKKRIFAQSEDSVGWLEKAYEDHDRSIRTGKEADPKHSAHQAGFKAKTARKISEFVDSLELSIDWLKKAYGDYGEAEKMMEGINENMMVLMGSQQAEIADILAGSSRSEEALKWLMKSYQVRESLIRKMKDEKNYAHQLTFLGSSAEKLAEQTKNREEKILWLKRAYKHNLESAPMIKKYDERHSAVTYLNLGKVSNELFELTKEEIYKEQAIEAYSTFINYFEQNKENQLIEIYKIAKFIVNKLQGEEIKKPRSQRLNRKKNKRNLRKNRDGGKEKKPSKRYKRKGFNWKSFI